MLGFYSVESGMEIHVIDSDPFSLSRGGGLTDVSLIEKYRMSEEAYNQRKGTLREFIKEQKAKDPNYKLKPSASAAAANASETVLLTNVGIESIAGMKIGDRCEVMPGKRRGVIQYLGEVPEIKEGYWVRSLLPLLFSSLVGWRNL
jgi:tubulin-specific chaperone B